MNLGICRILLPFFRISWCVGVLNSAICNSFHNRVEFGTILEGLRNFGGGLKPPPIGTPLRRYIAVYFLGTYVYCPLEHASFVFPCHIVVLYMRTQRDLSYGNRMLITIFTKSRSCSLSRPKWNEFSPHILLLFKIRFDIYHFWTLYLRWRSVTESVYAFFDDSHACYMSRTFLPP